MRQDELRPALYHRFHRLLPFLAHPAAHGLWRLLVWVFWLLYFAFVLLVLALRYSVLPNIERYRGDIERLASQGLGQAVSIGRIEASWDGINPDLTLFDVHVADAQGRPALAFSRVETILSWWSIPQYQLRLRLLSIDAPTLHLRRETDGRIFIAGIPLSQDDSDSDMSGWVLAQRRIRIRGATIIWEDAQRNAPRLVLEDVNFGLDNNGRQHRFGLTALPSSELASKIDLRGDFLGRDLDQLEAWKGRLYAEVDHADLAAWRNWIDYPVVLSRGHGGLRFWANFADGSPRGITADLALTDVDLQLAGELPAIAVDHVRGRIGLAFSEKGVEVSGRQVELVSQARDANDTPGNMAIRIEPTDFRINWQPDAARQTVKGSATASRLDLAALTRLAAYLPLDAHSRQLLGKFSPRGRIGELSAAWLGDADSLKTYSLKARFDDLSIKAAGSFPGFSGLSGNVETNEQGGSVSLLSHKPSIDLPSVFPESLTVLDTLSAQAQWKIAKGVLDAELTRAEFSGAQAAGSAHGSYRYTGQGPGSIDLQAALTRADARAVWRYMPHVVNANARQWLRDALTAGRSSEARLILKGDLSRFPFLDKRDGQFLVTVKAQDVTLDYARGWPKITGIHGDLRFEGAGMLVDVQRASMLGARLLKTRAEIPDFDANPSLLKIRGLAEGPTEEFLKFIEQSPVGERIDHFTEGMKAGGNGSLDLNLQIPLEEARLADAKVGGIFQFVNNEVIVDAALPPLQKVNGTLQFSEKDLRVPEINATLFGGPLKIKGETQPDGKVLIAANGSVNTTQLRRQADWPVFDSLSGNVAYRGEVRVRKRSADLSIDSNLLGLASSLPEPFNKSASEALPLHLEKTILPTVTPRGGEPVARDQLLASLGNIATLQIIRRKQDENYVPERGAIAIGRPLQMPERGLVAGVTAKRIDLDYWRHALHAVKNGRDKTAAAPALSLTAFGLKAAELDLLGHRFADVDLRANAVGALWKIGLSSREASGELQWDSAGRGKLTGRLKQLQVEPPSGTANAPGASGSSALSNPPAEDVVEEAIEELPALDIVAEDFSVGIRRFGRLELQARNEGRIWRLDKVLLSSPNGTLSGSGQWQFASGNRTQLDFKLDSNDVGKLLDRLGYPGTLRAGTAKLEGQVGWNGPPVDLDYATLSGEMKIDATKGQFAKLDPGAGKLLGLISLQSLPRRITLDFRDVFSEGFAFDSIAGKFAIQNGLLRTDRLQIDGPAARVVMRGETDLQHETQRLRVNVQPDLGGTAALGVALINPLAGVATLLAHKMLQNPLNQMFGFDYLVTGTWDDPKVEKLSRTEASPVSEPRLPNNTNPVGAANDNSRQ